MRTHIHIIVFLCALLQLSSFSQTNSPFPYCTINYSSGQCNQPGPSNTPGNFINDFIDDFSTSGANTNISNLGSGCNGGPTNYINYCQHYMAVTPGQTIVCTMKSGIIFGQGFAIFVDWNQDNVFNIPSEYMGGSAGVPAPATNTTITFVIPPSQPNGVYRMRVRCSFATPGINIPPCGGATFGEAEDYTIYVGPVPPTSAVPTGTALVNTPICAGQALNFSLSTTYQTALSYTWTGPGTFSSTIQNPSLYNSTAGASGVYTVLVTNGICPITRTVSALVVPYTAFTPTTNSYTICQGGSIVVQASLTTNSNPLLSNYWWSSSNPGLIFNPQMQITTIQPPMMPIGVPVGYTTYSITVAPKANTLCAITQTIGITINNPLTPTLTMPSVPLCNISSPVSLIAAPGGGTWSANPAVSANGTFSANLAVIGTNSVVYKVSAGSCVVSNSSTLVVSKYNTPALTGSINACVQDPAFNLMNIVQVTTPGYWRGLNVVNNHFNPAGLPTGTITLHHITFSTPDSLACKDSTHLDVPVFNPPTPTIIAIPATCNTFSIRTLTATPAGGVWSGNSGINSAGIQTPSLSLPGINSVTYTAGQGTCVASTFTTFNVSKFIPSAFKSALPDMCGLSIFPASNPVNLMNIVQNTTGIWRGPGIYSNTPTFFNPVGLGASDTLIYKTQSVPFNTCPDSTKIIVNVLTPGQANIAQAGPYCSAKSAVQLTVNTSGGHWVSTSYLGSTGIFTPALAPIGNNNVIEYIVGTNTCFASATIAIQVEAFVSAAIISKIDDQCSTNPPMSLVPFTINSSGFWTGPGLTGSTFNPGAVGTGSFVLNHHTSSYPSGLCPDQATVAVQVFSLAAPSITHVGPFCDISLPSQVQVSPVGGIFGGGLPGSISSGGVFNPASALIGDNYINYTVSVGPCKANAQAIISVEKFVAASFAKLPDAVYCKNQTPFNLNSFVQFPGGDWVASAGLVGANMFDPSLADEGTHMIIYQTYSSAQNRFLCPDADTVYIRIKKNPSVTARSSSYGDCAPLEVVLNTPGNNLGKRIWNITDGTRYEEFEPTHIFKQPGTYTVVLTYMDDEAQSCSTQVVLNEIKVAESPKADFSISPEEINVGTPLIYLTNQSVSTTNNKYVWTIQGQDPVSDLHAKAKFTQPGTYKVTLQATSVDGCKSEISKNIEVKNDFNIHIPNSFTPNFDGMNDVFIPVFTPYGLDTKTFDMEIFDRWGRQVYRTKDVSKGWDGTIRGSEIAKEDTYVYTIRYKDLDGRVYSKTGHLSLLRNN